MTRPFLAGAPIIIAAIALTGCTGGAVDGEDVGIGSAATGTTVPTSQTAEPLLQVTEPHEATGMTLLEGPVFGPGGELYVVDVTAPPGEPKVLRIDSEFEQVEPVFTDETGVYTSAQIGPDDGRLYLTDFVSGTILSITTAGDDPRVEFSGAVDGVAMHPDDMTFGKTGDLLITDSAGYGDPYWEASGRLVRLDRATSTATVLASELAAPNGIGFSPDYDSLWVGLNTGNQIDHIVLSDDGTQIVTAHPAIHVDGGASQVDSLAIDADGNIYAGLHNRPAIMVYSRDGEHLSTITMKAGDELTSATNIAIAPGGTDAYVTVSGPDGGFIYTFDALADGIRQSNGG
jgi:lactonase